MEKVAELGEQDRIMIANCQLPIANSEANRQSAIGNRQ
jgi:D-ribose pyranose/furanose isomerase RbsD